MPLPYDSSTFVGALIHTLEGVGYVALHRCFVEAIPPRIGHEARTSLVSAGGQQDPLREG
jgi:hypothetical protein